MKITIIQIVVIEDDDREQPQHAMIPQPFCNLFSHVRREIDQPRHDKEQKQYGPFITQ